MPFWMDMYFMDSNSPIMEMMIKFHDFSMTILVTIMLFLLFSGLELSNIYILNLNLMEDQTLELIWTIFPMFLLIFIALPSLRILYLMEESHYIDINVKITGCQWYWSYEFPEFELEFDSFILLDEEEDSIFRLLDADSSLVIPMNSLARFLVSSIDVIHSWTIQSLGVKTDAIPGRLNQINFYSFRPGVFYGQCSEICGINHSYMPISVQIIEVEDFLDEDYYF